MAYRPSPIEFPPELAAVPPHERNPERATNGIVLVLIALAGLLVSAAYAHEYVAEDQVRELWKPAIGVVVSLLVGAAAVSTILRGSCFVRRGDWVAVYERGRQAKVISISAITRMELSVLRTVKLVFASVVCMLICAIGLPMYLSENHRPVIIAWLLAAGIGGAALAIEIAVIRLASTTVTIDGVEHVLKRAP